MKNTIYSIFALCAFTATANAQAVTRTASGSQCQVITKSTGEKIKQNDVITFNVIQKTDKDSVLFSSYAAGRPVKLQVHPSTNTGDLMDVFTLLSEKDSAIVKVPVDSIFKGHEAQMPPFFSKGGNIVFNVKIEKVQSLTDAINERNQDIEKAKAAEAAGADAFIKSHNLSPLTTASGLKYMIKTPGPGPKPLAGDTVSVNYVGRTLDGKIFDTSVESVAKAAGMYNPNRPYEPLKFAVVTAPMIKGWSEGLLLLNEGSKATFIIPSHLGYGDQGMGDAIPPASTLVFDIDLVKVKRAKHTASAPVGRKSVKKAGTVKKRTVIKKKN